MVTNTQITNSERNSNLTKIGCILKYSDEDKKRRTLYRTYNETIMDSCIGVDGVDGVGEELS